MLRVVLRAESLAFRHPFTISKGTKTHQNTLIVGLGLGPMMGYGEAPAISYYDVTVEGMKATLERHQGQISRYAMQDPERFWHFLHHLMPGENFLTAALDIAAWDLFGQMRRKPLGALLGLDGRMAPPTDFTIGLGTAEEMTARIMERPWPLYKIKMGSPDDLDHLEAIRRVTDAPIRVDANEGWTFDEALSLLPELERLGVELVEQPLHKSETEAQEELKAKSPLPLFADESCVVEGDVERCAAGFHGINIKLTKCGGITPALRMAARAKELGLLVMLGSMNESSIGTAALAHLAPIAQALDADGPLLLAEDVADGVRMEGSHWRTNDSPGLGVKIRAQKGPGPLAP
jgi:L-alanine-DL-glutamate epimerase-like enolase superfamily enzyme